MKPYGLPRRLGVEQPDVGDIKEYGRASHVGRLREKCGRFKSYFRKASSKRKTRRYWKKLARRVNRKVTRLEEE